MKKTRTRQNPSSQHSSHMRGRGQNRNRQNEGGRFESYDEDYDDQKCLN